MSTIKDDTTITITTPDGETSEPFTVDDLERVTDQLREHDDGQVAIDGPGTRPQRQLTFDVGKAGGSPDLASLKIAGAIAIEKDLKRRAEVHVVVTDQHGEVLIESDATVTSIQFKDSTDQHGNVSTERIHVASLGAV